MDRGACEQAERKSSTSTLTPDLDNANVGERKRDCFRSAGNAKRCFPLFVFLSMEFKGGKGGL